MAERIGINAFDMIGLKAENLKCFGTPQGFETIKPFSVIIGKNNVGKSTLIDMIQYAVKPEAGREASGHKGRQL
jgi:putative ATP-dependent endonuclease of the OLD family